MYRPFEDFFTSLQEKNEHKLSDNYKSLSPKMKKAVDGIFKVMDDKPSDFLNTFEKTIKKVAKQNRVSEKDLMDYFEKEVLAI